MENLLGYVVSFDKVFFTCLKKLRCRIAVFENEWYVCRFEMSDNVETDWCVSV